MSIPKLIFAVSIATLATSAAFAGDKSAVTSNNELYKLDDQTGASTLVGSFKLGSGEVGLSHIARHPTGPLYGVSLSKAASHVYSLDDQTGAATAAFTLSTPAAAVGASVDPTDGSFWFANTFGFVWWASLTRVDLVGGTETSIGFINPTGDNYTGLAFDATGQLWGLNISQNGLWKIDKNNPANSVMVGAGLGSAVDISFGATLTFDQGTGQLMGHAVNGSKLFIVDTVTGVATVIPTTTPLPSTIIAIAEGPSAATCGPVLPYGAGCAGSGGFVPALGWSGCSAAGQPVSISISNGLGGSLAMMLLGQNPASLPMGGGCNLLISPILPGPIFLPLGGSGAGNGSVNLGAVLPAAASGAKFTMQSFVFDPATAIGGCGSNALNVTVF